MNYRFILRQLGLLMLGLCVALFLPLLYELINAHWKDEHEWNAAKAIMAAMVVGLALGVALIFSGKKGGFEMLGRREAMLLVASSWFLAAGVSALPYWLWAMTAGPEGHPFQSPAASWFEAVSGLTTTGATVLADIEAMPRGLLLWRALTHWLGGLGIVVLFVAVLPTLGLGAKRLFQAEITGPQKSGVRPRIAETARALWIIYLGLTIVLGIMLRLAGVPWFDSVCHAMSTIATGGLSTYNASIGEVHSFPVTLIIIVFMILSGVNFGLYYRAITGQARQVLRDTELRTYLAIIGLATAVVAATLVGGRAIVLTDGETVPADGFQSLVHGFFQVVAIQTTTGFCTADYDLWPFLAKAVLVGIMFVGGCAGSTSGGIKVIRVLIVFRVLWAELERAFRPNVVRPIRINGAVIDEQQRLAVTSFILLAGLIMSLGAFGVHILEPTIDSISATTAAISSVFNIGPGLGLVGATQNYGLFSAPTHVLLGLLMVLGRLEFFALLVLLTPRFWRNS